MTKLFARWWIRWRCSRAGHPVARSVLYTRTRVAQLERCRCGRIDRFEHHRGQYPLPDLART